MEFDARSFFSASRLLVGGIFLLLLLPVTYAYAADSTQSTWYWQEFAILRRDENHQPMFWCEIFRQGAAAYPIHGQIPAPTTAKTRQDHEPKEFPLRLSLAKGWFIIQSNGPKMVDWPDWYLLSRWWVNGKAIVPPHKEFRPRVLGRRLSWTTTMRVKFDWPDDLGKVRTGDRVALQVMYAPDGYTRAPLFEAAMEGDRDGRITSALAHSRATTRPWLSNRIEFVITPQQLAMHRKGKD